MSESLLLIYTGVRSLLDLQQNGILQHAEAMPATHQNYYISFAQLPGGDKLAVVVVDVNLTTPLAHDEHLRGAHDTPLYGTVRVALDLLPTGVNDIASLEIELRRRQESSLFRVQLRSDYITQILSIPGDVLNQVHVNILL